MLRVLSVLLSGLLILAISAPAPCAQAGDDVDPLTRAGIDRVKAGAHEVQIAVERFGIDHEFGGPEGFFTYPHSVSQLVIPYGDYGSYIEPGFYYNPWEPGEAGVPNARCLPYGWTPQHPGNFSYLAHYNNVGDVVCYMIVIYGPDPEAGWDLDGDGNPEGQYLFLMTGSPEEWPATMLFHDNGWPVELHLGRAME